VSEDVFSFFRPFLLGAECKLLDKLEALPTCGRIIPSDLNWNCRRSSCAGALPNGIATSRRQLS